MIETLLKINLPFWVDKNPYFNETDLNVQQKKARTRIQKHCGFLTDYELNSGADIKRYISHNTRMYRETGLKKPAIDTFDLIYVWGGTPRRGPYSNPIPRKNESDWVPIYEEFIQLVDTGEIAAAVEKVNSITGMMMAYGTKHLKFWGGYPIYDARMSALLYQNRSPKNKGIDYINYHDDIKTIGSAYKLNAAHTEQALFAFSQNYFMNGPLILKKNPSFKQDEDIAKELEAEWLLRNPRGN